jgi:hypothetical protein
MKRDALLNENIQIREVPAGSADRAIEVSEEWRDIRTLTSRILIDRPLSNRSIAGF